MSAKDNQRQPPYSRGTRLPRQASNQVHGQRLGAGGTQRNKKRRVKRPCTCASPLTRTLPCRRWRLAVAGSPCPARPFHLALGHPGAALAQPAAGQPLPGEAVTAPLVQSKVSRRGATGGRCPVQFRLSCSYVQSR